MMNDLQTLFNAAVMRRMPDLLAEAWAEVAQPVVDECLRSNEMECLRAECSNRGFTLHLGLDCLAERDAAVLLGYQPDTLRKNPSACAHIKRGNRRFYPLQAILDARKMRGT